MAAYMRISPAAGRRWAAEGKRVMDRKDGKGAGRSIGGKRVPRLMQACYGYEVDAEGRLRASPGEAQVVFYIFDRFISGQSLGQIALSLDQMGVPTPSGRPRGSRATLSNILSNEKYAGDVLLWRRDSGEGGRKPEGDYRLLRDHHEALISREVFEIAQRERRRRRRGKKTP